VIALLLYGAACALAVARVAWRRPRRGEDVLCRQVAKRIARDDLLPEWIRDEREWRFDSADMDGGGIDVTITTRPRR
jgi:hypothetical protein